MDNKKVNLKLLKRLVQELEFLVNDSEQYKHINDEGVEYSIALHKAISIANVVSQEAKLLATDIARLGIDDKIGHSSGITQQDIVDLFGKKPIKN